MIHTEIIQRLGNLDFLGGIEEGTSELFALAQCALNDFEDGDIAEEVAYTGVCSDILTAVDVEWDCVPLILLLVLFA